VVIEAFLNSNLVMPLRSLRKEFVVSFLNVAPKKDDQREHDADDHGGMASQNSFCDEP
jgi:hypothetical protein